MDTVSKKRRSEIMANIRAKDMKPEMVVRRLVHSMGYRYRLHRRDLPGRPDLAFMGRRKAIFVHGCFWHQHADCYDGKLPKSNRAYWIPKLRGNEARDHENQAKLADMGWSTLVIWECWTKDTQRLRGLIRSFLEG